MRARFLLVGVSFLVAALAMGCPDDWMIDGRIDQAMEKDMAARLHDDKPCAPGMHLNAKCKPNQDCKRCVQDKP